MPAVLARTVAAAFVCAAAAMPVVVRADEPASTTPAAPSAAPLAPFPSPFGPGYDTTKPPPTAPETSGPGIASATVIAVGPADIEEFHAPDERAAIACTAVVLGVHIPAASTTPVLGFSSVNAKSEDGAQTPVFAICLPTAELPVSVFHGSGGRIARWHVNVAGKQYDCGGRNARLAVQIGDGGMRIVTPAAWDGPMLLLFRTPSSAIRRVSVAGLDVELALTANGDTNTAH